ncbi:hypothetical protein ACFL6S_33380 [Candidatus Poribacteria bacterium]
MTFRALIIGLLLMVAAAGISSAFITYIDAEDAIELAAPMVLAQDEEDAFNGTYLVAPDGIGSDGNGFATYSFTVPKDDDYYFWGRVIAPDGSGDSFFWGIDLPGIPRSGENCSGETPGDEVHIWDTGQPFMDWTWSDVMSRSCQGGAWANQAVLELEKGDHVLAIIQREDGTKLDGIVISDDQFADLPETEADSDGIREPRPPGQPKPKPPKPTGSVLYIDTDDFDEIQLPMEIREDKDTAFGGTYLVTPNGAGSDGNGFATYVFNIPRDGKYYFWGRVIAPDGSGDSFFWSIDHPAPSSIDSCTGNTPGDEVHIWDTGQPFMDWTWSDVMSRSCQGGAWSNGAAVDLKMGEHVLAIIQREDGTELDGIVITDTPGAILPQTEADAEKLKRWQVSVEPKRKLSTFWGAVKTQK